MKHEHGSFVNRYFALLHMCSRHVHAMHKRGKRYTNTADLAHWAMREIPGITAWTLKNPSFWRVKQLLSAASYLGAMETFDIKSVRGRGFTPTEANKVRRLPYSRRRIAA